MMVRVEDPGMVHFGEIVIFGGHPEDRHGGNAVGGQPFGEPGGVERLENRISGSRKKTHLLPGCHHHGTGLRQARQGGAIAVVAAQRRNQGGALFAGELNFGGRGAKRVEIAQGMAIKRGSFIGMVEGVRGERSGVGQFCLADAETVHAGISLADDAGYPQDSDAE